VELEQLVEAAFNLKDTTHPGSPSVGVSWRLRLPM
jgi:hypothetical protein